MSGHGHVIPNADGSLARCGGPGICDECSREEAQVKARARIAEHHGAPKRVETGPIQIGDDWPGIYLRGDDALGLVPELERAIAVVERDGGGPFAAGAMRSLLHVLRSCDARVIEGSATKVEVTQ